MGSERLGRIKTLAAFVDEVSLVSKIFLLAKSTESSVCQHRIIAFCLGTRKPVDAPDVSLKTGKENSHNEAFGWPM